MGVYANVGKLTLCDFRSRCGHESVASCVSRALSEPTIAYVMLLYVTLLYSVVLDDSTLQVQVDSVRVLDDKLLVLVNNLFVRGGYPWISCIKVSENCMVAFLLCFIIVYMYSINVSFLKIQIIVFISIL